MSFRVFIDYDSIPKEVKKIVVERCKKDKILLYLVSALKSKIKDEDFVKIIVVDGKHDAADDYIKKNIKANDILITRDTVFASSIQGNRVCVIGYKGGILEGAFAKNLAIRSVLNAPQNNLNTLLGKKRGRTYSEVDKRNFANTFNEEVQRRLKDL